LVSPRWPSAAVGIDCRSASAVLLEKQRGGFVLRRAATITYPESLIRPGFDQPNIEDAAEFADALSELATSAGLLRQKKWSVSLPEGTVRVVILTLETPPASRQELEQVLEWKIERGFGARTSELRVSRERLRADAQGRQRYLAVGARDSVVSDYERVFESLGWHAGVVLPRHMGEEQWLRNGSLDGDALLVSSHQAGFTAVIVRDSQPLIVRSVVCDDADRADELFRVLLFYRDRIIEAGDGGNESSAAPSMRKLLVLGEGFDKKRVSEIVNETIGTELRPLGVQDVGLLLPPGNLTFDSIAAPAGLARLAWN
jgi:hypothetical protein